MLMLIGEKTEVGLQVRGRSIKKVIIIKKNKKANCFFLIHCNEIFYEKGNLVVFDACVCYWLRAKLFCLKFFKRLGCLFCIKFVDCI